MSVLDTFYLLFKTDIPSNVEKDIKNLDKQLDDVAKKGKKRHEEEIKESKESRKQRLEATDDIKNQRQETDKLGDSFQSMITNAVGAVTAYASFSFLKNALVDANNLNLSLKNLQGTFTNFDATKIEKYDRAFQLAGVPAGAFKAFAFAQKLNADNKGLPFDIDQIVKNLRQNAGTPNFERGKGSVSGLLGIVPGLRISQEEFDKNLATAAGSTPTQADLSAAQKNNEEAVKTGQTFNKISTQIDTAFSGAVKDFNEAVQLFLGAFKGHPIISAAGETAAGLGGVFLGTSLLKKVLGGGASGIAAGAAIKNPYVLGALAVGTAGVLAYEYAKKPEAETESTVPPQASSGSKSRKQQIIDFWIAKGYTPGQAAGLAANAQAESSFGTKLIGPDGNHFGLYQFSGDKRKEILSATNIDVATANLQGQLAASAWYFNKHGFTPGNIPTDAYGAGSYITSKFEIPYKGAALAAEAAKRGNLAASYGDIPLPGSAENSTGSGKTINVKIDDVKIETQASDAAGIAGAVAGELKNQIRMAIANIDDGNNA